MFKRRKWLALLIYFDAHRCEFRKQVKSPLMTFEIAHFCILSSALLEASVYTARVRYAIRSTRAIRSRNMNKRGSSHQRCVRTLDLSTRLLALVTYSSRLTTKIHRRGTREKRRTRGRLLAVPCRSGLRPRPVSPAPSAGFATLRVLR